MYIYDPLSIIIKLCILSKKKLGTKISMKNYIIEINNISFYQGLIRFLNNDSINDIILLETPINTACLKYLNNEIYKLCPNIVNIFKYAQYGLNNLILLYDQIKYNNITKIILNLISIIENYILKLNNNISLKKNNSVSTFNNVIISNNTFKKNFSTPSFINNNNINKNLKKTIIRYSATGYFSFDQIDNKFDETNNTDDSDNIYDNNYYYNKLINDNLYNDYNNTYFIQISDQIWTLNNINIIIMMIDNYININTSIYEKIIELYMNNIDNYFIEQNINYSI